MKTISFILLVLSSLFTNGAELLRGNFWPNPSFEVGENLDLPSGTPTGWQRGGSGTDFCQVMIAGSATNHALAVVDSDNRYGEWYSDVSLAGRVAAGDKLDLQWFEMYEVLGSEMRVTLIFLSASGGVVDVKHFVTRGTSEGYNGDLATSTFTKRNETLDVPEGAATLRFSLVSGGTLETQGFMAVDDLSAARHPAPILLAGNIWTNSPTFEVGVDLDLRTGTPENWKRGGATAAVMQVSTNASISPTHALAVVDSSNGYGEWYSDLPITNIVRAGDTLNLQWFEMFNISVGGEMRVTVLMLTDAGAVVDTKHFVARGRSSGWSVNVAGSTFSQRNESILVPEGAATLRVSLVSGGSLETTGTMVIDDLSVNVASPPLPEILPGNVWHNTTFEEGIGLDDPATAQVSGWFRDGSDHAIALLSSENSVSSSHALALVDNNAETFGEWSANLGLGANTGPGRTLDVQWFELFNTQDGEMRLSFVFFNGTGQEVGPVHFVAQGASPGWKGAVAGSTFTRRNEKIIVPTGARLLRASLVSGGSAATKGVMLIDNLSVAAEPNQPVALFGNFWLNPGFEEGAELDNPAVGEPTGWRRTGSQALVVTEAAMSSTHALAIVDTSTTTRSEWFQFVDLAGKAAAGDQIEIQWWELYNVNGEMSVTVEFVGGAFALHRFTATGPSEGWNEQLKSSFFTKRNETVTVPANATRMRVALTSDGVGTTGTMVIDDFSMAIPPPPPDILAGNVWPNPTFELGTQMDKPTLATLEGGWSRGGNHIPGDQVTTLRAKSPTHALAVVDTKEDAYSEWYVQRPIAGMFEAGDTLEVQWHELFDTQGGSMRVSFYFRDASQVVVGQRHFESSGQTEGWTGDIATSPFVKRNEQVIVPENTVYVMMTLTSGGPLTATGTYIIDDFSMRPMSDDLGIAIAKAETGWQFSWAGKAGKTYAVESTASLGAGAGLGFQPVPGLESIPAADNGPTTAVDTRTDLGAMQFYRVMELP